MRFLVPASYLLSPCADAKVNMYLERQISEIPVYQLKTSFMGPAIDM